MKKILLYLVYLIFNLTIASANNFIVTNTAYAGSGSLKAQLDSASANPGPDSVLFNIPGTPPHIIDFTSAPFVDSFLSVDSLIIVDGTSQPLNGYSWQDPRIVIYNYNGFSVRGPNSALYGLKLYCTLVAFGNIMVTGSHINIGGPGKGNFIRQNAYSDLFIHDASDVTVHSNVIDGQGYCNVLVRRSDQVNITGNKIGTDSSGFFLVSSVYTNIWFPDSVSNSVIGGSTPGDGNIIAANGYCHIWMGEDDMNEHNIIKGNTVGFDSAGINYLDSVYCSIRIDGKAQYNEIGGDNLAESNLLSFGIMFFDSLPEFNTIKFNRMPCYPNSLTGISGVTTYCANNCKASPLITGVTANSVYGTSDPFDTIRIFYSDTCGCASMQMIGKVTADIAGNWIYTGPVNTSVFKVLATATDALGNTSEFSACEVITGVPDIFSESRLNVFPNPFSKKINVKIVSDNGTGNGELSVSDVFGRVVLNHKIKLTGNLFDEEINTDFLIPGTYFLRLQFDGKMFVKKIVKT